MWHSYSSHVTLIICHVTSQYIVLDCDAILDSSCITLLVHTSTVWALHKVRSVHTWTIIQLRLLLHSWGTIQGHTISHVSSWEADSGQFLQKIVGNLKPWLFLDIRAQNCKTCDLAFTNIRHAGLKSTTALRVQSVKLRTNEWSTGTLLTELPGQAEDRRCNLHPLNQVDSVFYWFEMLPMQCKRIYMQDNITVNLHLSMQEEDQQLNSCKVLTHTHTNTHTCLA